MIRDRKALIDEIIEKRKPFLVEVERIQIELRKRAEAMKLLEQSQRTIMNSGIAFLADQIKDIKLADLSQRINDTLKEIEKPKARFARNTLNIGVIGRARQGKSQLLRSLSGLDGTIIPTGNTDHCTGVRSLICHDPGQQPHGEISFYSEREFLGEVIAPYYDKLKLGPPPVSLNSFANSSLPPLPDAKLNGHAVPGEQYRHLREYKEHLSDYRNLINADPRNIRTEEIREYVAQDSINGSRKYFKYLAVKEARIICTFQHPDVGQVALVDMPGLGDTGIGDEDRMIQALGEHLDVVLFVLMPTPASSILADVDFRLYDLAYDSLGGLPVERWSFMILNHTMPPSFGDNMKNCRDIREKIATGDRVGTNERRIKVVDSLIADCSQPEEAKSVVLESILEYLVDQLASLDMAYLAFWQKKLGILQADISAEMEKARGALSSATSRHSDTQQFNTLFESLWQELANGLEDAIQELAASSTAPNPTFTAYFKETFDRCRTNTEIPSKVEIRSSRNELNAYRSAYNQSLDRMRTHLTHQFVDIDEKLRLQMDEVKSRAVKVFLNEGKLANLARNGSSPQDFLDVMAHHPTLSQPLREAFSVFANYELSFRGFFQSRIRHNIANMIPDKTDKRPQEPVTPDSVIQTLREVYKETVDTLEGVLNRFAYEPSLASQAVIEEFVDQVLRSKHALKDWRVFYQTEQDKIWVSAFSLTAKREELQRQWQDRIRNVESINATNSLQFFRSASQAGSIR